MFPEMGLSENVSITTEAVPLGNTYVNGIGGLLSMATTVPTYTPALAFSATEKKNCFGLKSGM